MTACLLLLLLLVFIAPAMMILLIVLGIWKLCQKNGKRAARSQRAPNAPDAEIHVTHVDNTSASAGDSEPEIHVAHVTQEEADRLLDKISREGIDSLSRYEYAELQHFRKKLTNQEEQA